MTWTVLWVKEAEEDLAEIWTLSEKRDSISHAAYQIDDVLRIEPEGHGESRDSGRRILLVPPLGVLYRIDPQDQKVLVLTVWNFPSEI